MTPRLAAHVEVSALIRRIEGRGGSGVVLSRGDRDAGAILVLLCDRGTPKILLERILDISGTYRWSRIGPQDIESSQDVDSYMERRRRLDPDLWFIELDIAGVERFAAEMIATG